MLFKFCFMVLDDSLADEFSALDSALVNNDLMMLSQLDLVVFYGLIKGLILAATFFDIVDNLQQID